MERNKPVEKSQPVKEDNLFKHTGFSGNFPIGSTKNMRSIYFLSGITGIFMSMVNNQTLASSRESPLTYAMSLVDYRKNKRLVNKRRMIDNSFLHLSELSIFSGDANIYVYLLSSTFLVRLLSVYDVMLWQLTP